MSGLLNLLLGGRRRRRKRRAGGSMRLAVYRPRLSVMPMRAAGRRRRRLRGAGFLGDLWSGVKNVGKSLIRPALSAIKDPLALAAGTTLGSINPALGRLAQRGVYLAGSHYGFARRKRKVGGARKRKVGGARKRKVGGARKRVVRRRRVGGRRYRQLLF